MNYFNRALPFVAAFVLAAVGVFGLEANWRLAADGFGSLPGLESFSRLVWALALLPTALQAYTYFRHKQDGLTLVKENPAYVTAALVLTLIEINLVRLGIKSGTTEVLAAPLVWAEAVFLALGAEWCLVTAIGIAVREWRALFSRA